MLLVCRVHLQSYSRLRQRPRSISFPLIFLCHGDIQDPVSSTSFQGGKKQQPNNLRKITRKKKRLKDGERLWITDTEKVLEVKERSGLERKDDDKKRENGRCSGREWLKERRSREGMLSCFFGCSRCPFIKQLVSSSRTVDSLCIDWTASPEPFFPPFSAT